MPNTSEALIIALLFIAPGLLYELGIEREIGYWRTSLADRALRYFATSTIIHALAARRVWVWRSYLAAQQTPRVTTCCRGPSGP